MRNYILSILILSFLIAPVYANGRGDDDNSSINQQTSVTTLLGVQNETSIKNSSDSRSNATSGAIAGATAGGGDAYAKGGQSFSGSAASTGGVAVSPSYVNSVKYPNQAPTVFTTSSASYSQRNCTPVGSVNASGPFGGLGIAFPMGGDVCNGLNEADKISDWERESGDAKLWLVQCNLMVQKDSDLADAFEASGYSCKDAYVQRQAKINAVAKQQALMR